MPQNCSWQQCINQRMFVHQLVKKKGQPKLAGPLRVRKCTWDYNGTNSPRKAGLKEDHNLKPQRKFQLNIFSACK